MIKTFEIYRADKNTIQTVSEDDIQKLDGVWFVLDENDKVTTQEYYFRMGYNIVKNVDTIKKLKVEAANVTKEMNKRVSLFRTKKYH